MSRALCFRPDWKHFQVNRSHFVGREWGCDTHWAKVMDLELKMLIVSFFQSLDNFHSLYFSAHFPVSHPCIQALLFALHSSRFHWDFCWCMTGIFFPLVFVFFFFFPFIINVLWFMSNSRKENFTLLLFWFRSLIRVKKE